MGSADEKLVDRGAWDVRQASNNLRSHHKAIGNHTGGAQPVGPNFLRLSGRWQEQRRTDAESGETCTAARDLRSASVPTKFRGWTKRANVALANFSRTGACVLDRCV